MVVISGLLFPENVAEPTTSPERLKVTSFWKVIFPSISETNVPFVAEPVPAKKSVKSTEVELVKFYGLYWIDFCNQIRWNYEH